MSTYEELKKEVRDCGTKLAALEEAKAAAQKVMKFTVDEGQYADAERAVAKANVSISVEKNRLAAAEEALRKAERQAAIDRAVAQADLAIEKYDALGELEEKFRPVCEAYLHLLYNIYETYVSYRASDKNSGQVYAALDMSDKEKEYYEDKVKSPEHFFNLDGLTTDPGMFKDAFLARYMPPKKLGE